MSTTMRRTNAVSRFLAALVACVICVVLPSAEAHSQGPAILRRVRVDPNRVVDFHAGVFPETLYVGQQATYQVAVLLDEVAGSRLPRNPEYLPPELRGMLAYELGGQQRFTHDANNKRYTAHVFQKALFPLAEGTFTIPAPQLSYALRQSASYFSREEAHSLKAESVTVVVRALPADGKPADFSGAVGVLKASVALDAATARVGDPLVLTLKVQGSGNIKLLPRPTLELEWATSVPGTERLQMDTSGAIVRGAKEFDWILTPTRDGEVATPTIPYSYFNPNTKKYETAEAAPVTFAVNAGGLANREEGEASRTMLPLRDHSTGVVPVALLDRYETLLALALLPLPAIALLLMGVPRQREETAAIDKLRALLQKPTAGAVDHNAKHASAPTDLANARHATARDVRRLLLASLAWRLDVNSETLTDRKKTSRVLRRRGVTPETADALQSKLSSLDLAAFAPANTDSNTGSASLSADVIALYDRVDSEAIERRHQRLAKVVKRSRGIGAAVMIASVSLFGGTDRAEAQGAEWKEATDAYNNHQFQDAASAFGVLAFSSPRDADVLANWGTAAWAAGDTVTAVLAWQRAARLDPLAADIREHLMLLPSGSRDGVADVPLVPVTMLGYLGISLWGAGWLLAAGLLWRRRSRKEAMPIMNMLAVACLVFGAMSGATSYWGARQLHSDRLAVVRRPETLRETPQSESNALGGAATGDVVRIDEVAANWVRVEHADGRTGWMPTDRLMLLSATTQR